MLFLPYRLWDSPPVVAYQERRADSLRAMLRTLEPGTHLLFHCSGPTRGGLRFFSEFRHAIRAYPGVTLHLIANTDVELAAFRTLGLPVAYGPVSAYVNEVVFQPEPVEKRFDAIYVAHFTPSDRAHVKRHQLAASVTSLAIVTNALQGKLRVMKALSGPEMRRAFYETYPELQHAEVNDHYLPPKEVAHALSLARVNLALSAAEGCMLAFTEGLLCGVPAVSTVCRSARTEFFDPRFVSVVEDQPRAIADAVRVLAARSLDSGAIREFALARQLTMRLRYVEYIAELVKAPARDVFTHLFDAPDGIHRLSYALEASGPPARPTRSQVTARGHALPAVRRRWG